MVKFDHNCTLCPLHEQANTICMKGYGPKTAPLMIVGEAPGKEEDKLGRPFVGDSGILLAGFLNKAGINANNAYITNVCKCRPPANRTPTRSEAKACRPYLQGEIAAIQPKYVLLLGNTALNHIGKTGITALRGQPFEIDDTTYFATFHPAAALRDPGRMPAIEQDLKKLAGLMSGEETISSVEEFNEWKYVREDNVEEFLAAFARTDWFTFDIETTDLRFYRLEERITAISFCLDDFSCWVIPVRELDEQFVRKLLFQLANFHKKAIGHNGKFDNSWLTRKYGVRFDLRFDTCLAAHILDENRPNGLKPLARTLLGAPDYDISKKDKLGLGDYAKLCKYNAMDSYYTHKLSKLFGGVLRTQPALRKLFTTLVMPIARLYEEIEQEGLYINLKGQAELKQELNIQLHTLERELQNLSGERRLINWDSPKQVSELFFGKLGLTPTNYTPKGQPSTNEDALLELRGIPAVDKLLEYRHVQKMLTTYVVGWEPFIHGHRVYLDTKINGTVTGRFSGRLHQVPRDTTIRSLIDEEDGYTLVIADYNQIELRIAAMLANERRMKFIFQTGGDIHTVTAQEVLGISGTPTDEERRGAKGVNFGFIYGMREPKFQKYMLTEYGIRITLAEARAYRKRYFQLYPDLPVWHNKMRQLVRNQGYVTNLLGRIRRLPSIDSKQEGVAQEAERQGINAPTQSFGSGDLKALGMLAIHRHFDPKIVMLKGEVHDSTLTKVRTTHLKTALPTIKRLMECPPDLYNVFGVELDVPIVVDIELGPWGSKKKVKFTKTGELC